MSRLGLAGGRVSGRARNPRVWSYERKPIRPCLYWLQAAFDSLACEFPGRVAYGWLVRAQASRTHWLVWGANVENVQGAPGERIPGGGQALAMATHGEGVFGIVTTPVAGVP